MRFKFSNPVRDSFRVASSATGAARRRAGRRYRVEAITVDPRVWQAAFELANGDALWIEVIHAEEVIVHNDRSWQ